MNYEKMTREELISRLESLNTKLNTCEREQSEEKLNKQARIALLGSDTGKALTMSDSLRMMLQKCAEALVKHLDASFARIWTLNSAGNTLELRASAGKYTHIDGPHSQVPVGKYKIGMIAQECEPHLTNDVINDPRVSDREWAKREGMVAFAGYPLIVEDRLVGVMAMFARQPLTKETMYALASVSDQIALGIVRKRGEEKIRKLSRVVEQSPTIVVMTDTKGDIEYVNPEFTRVTGYSFEEALGQNPRILQSSETPQKVYELMWKTITSDREWRGTFYNKKKSGEFYFESAYIVPIKNDDGDIINYVAVKEDITERKQNEERIKIKNSFLKLHQIAAVSTNEATKFEDAFKPILKEICHAKGWQIGHVYIISKDITECLEPTTIWYLEDTERFADFCNLTETTKFLRGIGLPGRVLSGSKPHWIIDVTKDPNFPRALSAKNAGIKSGIAFPVMIDTEVVAVLEFFCTRVVEPDNSLLEITADIGKELRRVVERNRSEKEIKGLAKFPDENPNPMLRVSNKGEILYNNQASMTLLIYWDCRITKVLPDKYIKIILDVLRSGLNKVIEVEYKERVFSLTFAPVVSEDYVNIYGMDITERKRMEEDILKVQKLESLGMLAGGIAHDFNNSLQAVLGYISIAEMHTDPNGEIHGYLKDARKAVLDTRGLTQQLLTFSKGGTPVKRTVSLPELIVSSVKLCLSGSNVRCELGIKDTLWSVEADKGQINQVINNIIINADQAMPEGGNIKVWTDNIYVVDKDSLPLQDGRYVKITIQDFGTGISQKHLQKIFDPYFTTKQKGNGLGLAATYSIVKKHGGHITVESEIGVGTTFHIYLPASEKNILKETAQRKVNGLGDKHLVKENVERPSISKRRILIMDDENIIREILSKSLKSLKYEVEAAGEGSEAICLYKGACEAGNPFDAVIMDLTISGGMGGKETIKRLLEIDPEVKAIVSSGYANDPVMANYRQYGFKGVLAKPHGIHELDNELQKVIAEMN